MSCKHHLRDIKQTVEARHRAQAEKSLRFEKLHGLRQIKVCVT